MVDDTQMTEVKTMWSETLLETLYAALEKNKSDTSIKELLGELAEKGYKKDYLVEKVTKKVGPNAASNLKRIMAGGAASKKSSSGKTKTAKKSSGLGAKLKGLFK